jgi:biofilm protein TabA
MEVDQHLNMKLELYIFCCCLMLAACNGRHDGGHADASNHHAANWFEKGTWRHGWEINADQSLDTAEFSSRYSANPARWEKAFEFLATTDLANKEPGRYQLEGEQLFALVLDYTAKEEADTRFEAHKKYADIQYVIEGRERIGVAPLASAQTVVPYDEAQDIAFFRTNESNYRPASPENFFVFFPDEAHRPGVRVSAGEHVKKIVIKVKL